MITFSDLELDRWDRFWFTATDPDTGRSHRYPVIVGKNAAGGFHPAVVANAFVKARDFVTRHGLPPAYDPEADREALRAEYAYPNPFRKAP